MTDEYNLCKCSFPRYIVILITTLKTKQCDTSHCLDLFNLYAVSSQLNGMLGDNSKEQHI